MFFIVYFFTRHFAYDSLISVRRTALLTSSRCEDVNNAVLRTESATPYFGGLRGLPFVGFVVHGIKIKSASGGPLGALGEARGAGRKAFPTPPA